METEIHHRIHKCQGPRLSVWKFRYKVRFYGKELLAPRSTPKQEVHPLQAVHDCLFNILADDIHIGGRSSIRNLRPPRRGDRDPLITRKYWLLVRSTPTARKCGKSQNTDRCSFSYKVETFRCVPSARPHMTSRQVTCVYSQYHSVPPLAMCTARGHRIRTTRQQLQAYPRISKYWYCPNKTS